MKKFQCYKLKPLLLKSQQSLEESVRAYIVAEWFWVHRKVPSCADNNTTHELNLWDFFMHHCLISQFLGIFKSFFTAAEFSRSIRWYYLQYLMTQVSTKRIFKSVCFKTFLDQRMTFLWMRSTFLWVIPFPTGRVSVCVCVGGCCVLGEL